MASKLPPGHIMTLPATEIAREKIGRPIPNVAMLGALAGMTGIVTLDALFSAIKEKFSKSVAEKNIEAARAAYDMIKSLAETTEEKSPAILVAEERC
jgi:pyruvate ferredoxin oxidoreductase gamma subunit